MSEQSKELTIASVEGPNDSGWYVVKTSDGKRYGTKNAGISAFEGKTATFKTASIKKGNYSNNYINDPLPTTGEAEPEKTGSGESTPSSMLMSYAKDLTVAAMHMKSEWFDGEGSIDGFLKRRYEKLKELDSGVPF